LAWTRSLRAAVDRGKSYGIGRSCHPLADLRRRSAAGPVESRYADFDNAVATYNQTLVSALSDVATQLAQVRSTDTQLVDAQQAQQASRRADELALKQYAAGLTNQLTVLNSDVTALQADQAVAACA